MQNKYKLERGGVLGQGKGSGSVRVKFGYTPKGTLEGDTFNVVNRLNYHLGYT